MCRDCLVASLVLVPPLQLSYSVPPNYPFQPVPPSQWLEQSLAAHFPKDSFTTYPVDLRTQLSKLHEDMIFWVKNGQDVISRWENDQIAALRDPFDLRGNTRMLDPAIRQQWIAALQRLLEYLLKSGGDANQLLLRNTAISLLNRLKHLQYHRPKQFIEGFWSTPNARYGHGGGKIWTGGLVEIAKYLEAANAGVFLRDCGLEGYGGLEGTGWLVGLEGFSAKGSAKGSAGAKGGC